MTLRTLHLHAGNLYGGVERILVTLATCEAGTPLRSAFALAYEGRLSEELREAGAPVASLAAARLSRPWTAWKSRRDANRLMREARPDVAICHSDWSQALYGPAAQKLGIPLVRWVHGPLSGLTWLERLAARVPPAAFVCTSEFTRATVDRFYPGALAAVVHPPVPERATSLGTRERLRREFGAADRTTVLLQVGRMERGKGHDLLIEALAQLRHRADWTAWVVGGAQRDEEIGYVGSLGLRAAAVGIGDRVRFLGERRDVDAILRAADIFCHPNVVPEAFGIVFVEALQAALPVLTTGIGGALEIVDDSCGRLLPPGDAAGLAAAIEHLLEHPAELRALADGGPPRARAICNPANQINALAAFLAEVAGAG
jgi:glycosyltransferase involved in cell wall biosynthesis